MPNRVLRDWTYSEVINELSTGAEVFFTRLIMKVDDFGAYHGNVKLLKSATFPLRDIKDSNIEDWITELVRLRIVIYYKAEGKKYIRIKEFNQRTRIKISKFPEPEAGQETQENDGQTSDNGRRETRNRNQNPETRNQKPKKEEAFSFKKSLLEYGFDSSLVSDWLKVRVKKKATNTETAFKKFIREVEKIDADKNLILQTCVERDWKGVQKDWYDSLNIKSDGKTNSRVDRNNDSRKRIQSELLANVQGETTSREEE